MRAAPLLFALSLLAPNLLAQSPRYVSDLEGARDPRWLYAWSPVVPLAELPRTLAGSDIEIPHLLILPAPPVGLFWTAGNPAGLSSDIDSSWTGFDYSAGDVAGTYRRPLDAGSRDRWSLAGQGWGSLGGTGAGIGRIRVDRSSLSQSAFADVLVPYASEPYTVMDTVGEETGRTSVLIEGAGGWSIGRFGFGLSAGYFQQETRTKASAVPRLYRTTMPGGVAGISYGGSRLRIGAHARWQQSREVVQIFSVADVSRVYPIRGYDDPVAVNLVATLYSRRFGRKAWAWGGSADGHLKGITWAAFLQREELSAWNFNASGGEGLSDTWTALGWRGGVTAQSGFDRTVGIRVDVAYQTVDGQAAFADIPGIPFQADEKEIRTDGTLRFRKGPWLASVQLGVSWIERIRHDDLARTETAIQTWRPRGVAELARSFGPLALSIGGGMSEHNPTGSIPDPDTMGPVYRNWMAPEVALEVSEAGTWLGFGSVRWRVSNSTALWIHGRYERASTPESIGVGLPGRPTGQRNGWVVGGGVVLRKGR